MPTPSDIATGIGAIWAALAARRQAQVTERTLAQQNETTRLNLEVDLPTKLADRLESPHFLSRRREAAKHLIDNIDNALVEDDAMVEVGRFNRAACDVANFYDELGELQRLRALQAESVWASLPSRSGAKSGHRPDDLRRVRAAKSCEGRDLDRE